MSQVFKFAETQGLISFNAQKQDSSDARFESKVNLLKHALEGKIVHAEVNKKQHHLAIESNQGNKRVTALVIYVPNLKFKQLAILMKETVCEDGKVVKETKFKESYSEGNFLVDMVIERIKQEMFFPDAQKEMSNLMQKLCNKS